jgi:hypothetical protein
MRSWSGGALVACVAALGAGAIAQETTTGSISGTVTGPHGGAVPGAVVTLGSGQGTRTFATDPRGRFVAPYLTPGVYSVRVELSGLVPVEQQDVRVRLGHRVDLDLRLTMGELKETIRVVATSPVVDMSSTTAGGVLDSDELQRLPVPRDLASTLYMVPGVSSPTATGTANPSIGGGSALDNQYVVDGVNITNQGFGALGVFTPTFGSIGTGVTTDFIKETQVKTAGFEAEYGQATGGVVNVVTRSGSNAFHGSVFGYWRPPALEGSWRQIQTGFSPQVNTSATESLDFGVSLGGPVVRDRLFYVAAFNPQYDTRTLIAPESSALRARGGIDRKRRSLSYAGKLTWQVADGHSVDLSAFGDPSYGAPGPQRSGALASNDEKRFSELTSYGGDNQAVRYNGVLTASWWVEATLAHAHTFHSERPKIDEQAVTDRTAGRPVFSGGIGAYEAGTEGRNLQLGLTSTHMLGAGGSHEIRYGLRLEDIEYTRFVNRTGPSHTFPDEVSSRTGVTVTVWSDPELGEAYEVYGVRGEPPNSTQRYLSWFAQDTWRVGSRWTLRPGIRWERQRIVGGTPLCFSDESHVGAGDGTPGDEIPCAYTWTGNWAPRLGATFDVTGSGRWKVYASWGRFFVKVPNAIAVYALSAEDAALARYLDPGLRDLAPDGFRTFNATPAEFANGSRSTFQRELLIGVETEVAPYLNLGLRYIRRRIPRVVEDYAPAQPLLWDLGYEGLEGVTYLVDNIHPGLETIDATSIGVPRAYFEDPVHDYDAVEVTGNKAFANGWSLFASYRWSRLRGNFEGFFRADNGQSLPALTSLFDFPTNDPSYTQIGAPRFGYRGDIRYQGTTLGVGPLPNDRTHQVKLYGAWARGGLSLGVAFRAGSGQPLTALAANPVYAGYEIPETLRGEGFETVDGFRKRSPAPVTLDLHVDYAILLGANRRLLLVADLFNVLNSRDPITYNWGSELRTGIPNPDFGQPANPLDFTSPFETPRQVRLGARLEW